MSCSLRLRFLVGPVDSSSIHANAQIRLSSILSHHSSTSTAISIHMATIHLTSFSYNCQNQSRDHSVPFHLHIAYLTSQLALTPLLCLFSFFLDKLITNVSSLNLPSSRPTARQNKDRKEILFLVRSATPSRLANKRQTYFGILFAKMILSGILNLAILPSNAPLSSFSISASSFPLVSLITTAAQTFSPYFSSATPNVTASPTEGSARMAESSSIGEIFSPPLLINYVVKDQPESIIN